MIILYLLVFVYGIVIGSFLNVCIYRIPNKASIAFPASHCMTCGTELKANDLVPIFSYLLLGGKCRYCKTKISARYPLIELLTGLVFIVVYWRYSISLEFFAYVFLMSILIAVFFIDFDCMIIPDELVLVGLAGGIAVAVINIFKPMKLYGDTAWWNPAVGMLTGSGILIAIAFLGMLIYKTEDAMGMGDVKIFAPIGLFLGWRMTLLALMVAVILAGLASVVLLVLRIKKMKSHIPFGPFIVTATFLVIIWGWNILGWYLGFL